MARQAPKGKEYNTCGRVVKGKEPGLTEKLNYVHEKVMKFSRKIDGLESKIQVVEEKFVGVEEKVVGFQHTSVEIEALRQDLSLIKHQNVEMKKMVNRFILPHLKEHTNLAVEEPPLRTKTFIGEDDNVQQFNVEKTRNNVEVGCIAQQTRRKGCSSTLPTRKVLRQRG